MAYRSPWRSRALVVGMVLAAWLVSGCGSSSNGRADGKYASWPTVTMIAFNDQWGSSLPRYYDIADLLFKKTLSPGTIQFRYDPATTESCLVGEIKGWNLKPNFCYQLKLMGKPGTADGGLWGAENDSVTNAAILTNARWWNYKADSSTFTTTNAATTMASQDYLDGWVAGYVYFGYVMTDENGAIKCYGGKTAPTVADASGWVPIRANRCYHITAKTGQESGFIPAADTTPLAYTLARTSYGYTSTTSATVSLWYEKEPDNPLDFALPAGNHDVVLMVTEESFHNKLGGLTNTTDGGYWDSVWVSDWSTTSTKGGIWTGGQRGGRIQFATGSANAAPGATLVSPADGGTALVNAAVPIQIAASSADLTVTWKVGDGASQAAAYNSATNRYEATWNTTGLAVGSAQTIVATATSSAGLVAITTNTVTMSANQAPVAGFTYTQSGKACTFTSTSTDADGTIASSAWTFGDGGTASGTSVSHTYAANGTYTVKLTVTDNVGATSSTTKVVTVNVQTNVMTPAITVTWLGNPGKYQPHAAVLVTANGAPLAGAAVTGAFSGTFTSKASAVTTGSDGKALFYGPPRTKSKGALTFTVSKITKTGYTSAGLPASGSYAP